MNKNIHLLLVLLLSHYNEYVLDDDNDFEGLCPRIKQMWQTDYIHYDEMKLLLSYLTKNRPKDDRFGTRTKYIREMTCFSDSTLNAAEFSCEDEHYWTVDDVDARLNYLKYHIQLTRKDRNV